MPLSDQKRIDVAERFGNIFVRQRGKSEGQKTSAVGPQPIGCVGVAIERVAFGAGLGNYDVTRGDAGQFAQGRVDLARPYAQQNAAGEHHIEGSVSERKAVRGRLVHLEAVTAPRIKHERRNIRSHEPRVAALRNGPKVWPAMRSDFEHACGRERGNRVSNLRAQGVRARFPIAVSVGGVSRLALCPKAPRRGGLSVEKVKHAVH